MKCSCREVEFEEGKKYKRTKGIGHSPSMCAPNMYEEGLRDVEEDEDGEAKPVKGKKPRKEKKARKPKKFKWSISNGLRNVLVIAKDGAAFEDQLARYTNRKDEVALLTWAAGHTCAELRKFKGMGGKKLVELTKRLTRVGTAGLRLKCGCPCPGVPMISQLEALAATPDGRDLLRKLLEAHPGITANDLKAKTCGCPMEGSEAWDRGERCPEHGAAKLNLAPCNNDCNHADGYCAGLEADTKKHHATKE